MTLVVLGYGYSSRAFVREAGRRFERVVGTARTREKAEAMSHSLPRSGGDVG